MRGAITAHGGTDVMRFVGRKPHGNFQGEVVSRYRERAEGVRIRHTVQGNSVKADDKEGRVPRIETTPGSSPGQAINDPRGFKAYRRREADPDGEQAWRRMRKGIADRHRRAVVAQACNDRYASALAAVEITRRLGQVTAKMCSPVTWKGKRVRGPRPFSPDDHALFAAIAGGAFAVNGLRNRDLLAKLHPGRHSREQRRRLSARTGRKLRLLRAHGIIKKVTRSHLHRHRQRPRIPRRHPPRSRCLG